MITNISHDFGRQDLNELQDKLNEVINFLNEKESSSDAEMSPPLDVINPE